MDSSWVPADRPALREAVELLERRQAAQQKREQLRPRIPSTLFDGIEDRENIKRLLHLALVSGKPVHVLLVGPPGCGKTEFLLEMQRLWGSQYATGAMISQAGIVQFLQAHPDAQRLLIDDIDKADKDDLWALLELMQSGTVTVLKHDQQLTVERKDMRVMAAANVAEKLPDPLLDRFIRQDCPPYSPAEFNRVAVKALTREGVSERRARLIAEAVASRSLNPRDALQVGRLAGGRGDIGPILDQVVPA